MRDECRNCNECGWASKDNEPKLELNESVALQRLMDCVLGLRTIASSPHAQEIADLKKMVREFQLIRYATKEKE